MSTMIVARVGEIPEGKCKRVTVRGQEVVVFHVNAEYFAMINRCPHEGAALSEGRLCNLVESEKPGLFKVSRNGELLRCPWHGWEFDIRTGRTLADPERAMVRSFRTEVVSAGALSDVPQGLGTYDISVEDDLVLLDTAKAPAIAVRIEARRQVAEGIVALDLVSVDGRPLPPFRPGDHVDLTLANGMVRQYSLCGDPAEHGKWRVAIHREPASRGGSQLIHDTLHDGDVLPVGYPRNNFRLNDRAARSLLIAGGIGITPILSMGYRLGRLGRAFELHYLARDRSRAAFVDEMKTSPFANAVHLHFDGGDPARQVELRALLAGEAETEVYVCGPAGLIDAVTATHKALGFAPHRLHVERFSAEIDSTGPAFEIEARRSGRTVTVPKDVSMADALAEAGIPVNVSCGQGVCGTCLTAVIEGTPDHRDSFQSEAEKATGAQVALCCSRASGNKLILDV